ncbi:hypothetical protein BB561_002263 [Smittium simulii]|uniref:EGF-like domain-containing protein n=1 Tax=Smittium simulii TaxID=133385 RepID=A0A2T9YR10_9FUNG|nr:hypothetical protein BB561_002263 [Smittium simulii]
MRTLSILLISISCVFYNTANAAEQNSAIDQNPDSASAHNPPLNERERCIMENGGVTFTRGYQECACLNSGKVYCYGDPPINYAYERCVNTLGRGSSRYIDGDKICQCQTDGTSKCEFFFDPNNTPITYTPTTTTPSFYDPSTTEDIITATLPVNERNRCIIENGGAKDRTNILTETKYVHAGLMVLPDASLCLILTILPSPLPLLPSSIL